jgi:glucosyl-dolichyl phosphate glucuronosyltransferase
MLVNNFISIIIPTRNRVIVLEKFLHSLTNQTLNYNNYETIIIDNGSKDGTASLVKQFTQIIPNLHYYFEPNPGLHSGRHRGLLESKGEILVYADDDIQALPTWLETIQKCFQENPDVVMVGGKNLPNFETEPPNWLLEMWKPNNLGEKMLGYLSILDLGDKSKLISPYYIFGCNFAIRRSILEEAGGFHPDGLPQELIKYRGDGESYVSSYVQREGYKALYHPEASVYHWVSFKRMTLEYFCQRAYNQGISDSYTQIRKKYRELNKQPTNDNFSSWQDKIKSIYQKIRSKSLRDLFRILLTKITKKSYDENQPENELDEMQQQIALSYQEGFAYHQEQVEKDPQLLGWVLRPNYWDYQLPCYDDKD